MVKQLIVNADDYGHSPGINRGILDAHLNGIVTSTSVMITCPNIQEAIDLTQRAAPDLGLGLHLTFTDDAIKPILSRQNIPTLTQKNGAFYSLPEWFSRCDQFDPDEIKSELTAQYEYFLNVVKRPPDHLDSHNHAIYRHPAAFKTALELSRRHNLPIRHYHHYPEQTLDEALLKLVSRAPTHLHQRYVDEIKSLIHIYHPAHPNHFYVNFYKENASLDTLLGLLSNLRDGVTEIMCHPGYLDKYLVSAYSSEREDELAILTQAVLKMYIKNHNIELVTFAAI